MMALLRAILALFARPAGTVVAEGPKPRNPWPDLSATDRDVLIRTLLGEAGNESEAGQIAVVHTVRNRLLRGPASRFGATPAGVCQKPWQFSCWNASEPTLPRMKALKAGSAAYEALGAVVDKAWQMPDSIGGADHYYASYIAKPAWAKPPARVTVRHGVHAFYAGVA